MTEKKNHHHHHAHHHHHHTHKKVVQLKSIERITSLPVVESAHAYYEKIKNSNPILKWSLLPAETGMWLAVETAMPVVSYFERPISTFDTIICHGLDVIETNLPVVTYPPELVYSITKDYVTAKVVTPMLRRADSVKQLSISGANICGELAADRLNDVIDVADKYVEKYLPDISDTPDSAAEISEGENHLGFPNRMTKVNSPNKICYRKIKGVGNERRKIVDRLHIYCDGHGKLLTDKLKKLISVDTEVYVCLNPKASSSYIVANAIDGTRTLTRHDAVVLIAGMDDLAVGKDVDTVSQEYLANIEKFINKTSSTNGLICPILPQYDLPLTGTINKAILEINNLLKVNSVRNKHIIILDTTNIQRKHFTRSGLYLNGQGKYVLAQVIVAGLNELRRSLFNGNLQNLGKTISFDITMLFLPLSCTT